MCPCCGHTTEWWQLSNSILPNVMTALKQNRCPYHVCQVTVYKDMTFCRQCFTNCHYDVLQKMFYGCHYDICQVVWLKHLSSDVLQIAIVTVVRYCCTVVTRTFVMFYRLSLCHLSCNVHLWVVIMTAFVKQHSVNCNYYICQLMFTNCQCYNFHSMSTLYQLSWHLPNNCINRYIVMRPQ